jgi:hypothetical protein
MSKKSFFSSPISAALLALCAALGLALPLSAQKPWPPISPEDMAMKDCPQQPGAAAIGLYYEMTTTHEDYETSYFKRLKILTPAGRDHANIEIPYFRGWFMVKDLEARVVPAQGQPRPFTGQVFDKTALHGRGIRMSVKSFALPDVEPGSIIDYRYKIVPDYGDSSGGSSGGDLSDLQLYQGKPEEGGFPKNMEILSWPAIHWEIQDELFTRKAKFVYISHPYIWTLFQGPCRLAWVTHGLKDIAPIIKGTRVDLEIENVPAFEDEEFMTPEEAEQMSVDVFYLDRRIKDSDEFWRRECRNWQKSAEAFIGDPGKLAAEAQKIVEDATDPVERLGKIYRRAQDIRNLSYEKSLTRRQRKEQKIKENRKAAEALEHDYGVRSDITRTFVALARAAGFEADVARVSTRDDKLFRINLFSFYDQLDSEVALVKLGEKTMLFDPATPYCPFGLVHWSRSNAAAVRFSDKPPAFFTTSVYLPDLALIQRELVLQLDPQGNISGTVKVTYTGHEALVRRLEHIHSDETDKKKDFEKELSDILPMGAVANMKQLENIDNIAPSLVAHFDVSIPNVASAAGDRILLPVSPLLGSGQYPFRHAERKFPIYFPFPFREFNDIVITLPEGMTVETRPEPQKNQGAFYVYQLLCVQEGPRKLHVQRDLIIQKSYFPLEQYAAVKAFYDKVRTSDEGQVVLAREKK